MELGNFLYVFAGSQREHERHTAENPCFGTWEARKRMEIQGINREGDEVLSMSQKASKGRHQLSMLTKLLPQNVTLVSEKG